MALMLATGGLVRMRGPRLVQLGTQDICSHAGQGAAQVAEYVKERVLALRREHPGQFGNIACARTNTQKYLTNFFFKAQLTKLFFLFPARAWNPPPPRLRGAAVCVSALASRIVSGQPMVRLSCRRRSSSAVLGRPGASCSSCHVALQACARREYMPCARPACTHRCSQGSVSACPHIAQSCLTASEKQR